jgi:hypothetical protein
VTLAVAGDIGTSTAVTALPAGLMFLAATRR